MSDRKSKSPPQRKRRKRAKPNIGAEFLSVNALSKITGKDRRTIDKIVAKIPPAKIEDGRKLYRLADVEALIAAAGADKSLKDEKLDEEIRKLRIRNDREDGKLIERAKVAETIRRIMGELLPKIESKLCNEYPTAVAGLEPAQARVYGKRIYDQIVEAHQAMAKEWA